LNPRAEADLPEAIGARMKQAGVRLSARRRAVLTALLDSQGHLSREELALRLRDERPKVSLSTVYRFVHVLVTLGIAREIKVGDIARVELDLGRENHDHLVCVACGGIVEFHDDDLESLARSVIRAHGFADGAPRIEVRGTCAVCAASSRDARGHRESRG
jgi:Fur family ferric uptake transcriptional regulator